MSQSVQTKKMIGKADKELKFDICESFESIPFNLVGPKILKDKQQEVREKYLKAFEKAFQKNSKDEDFIPLGIPDFSHYHFQYWSKSFENSI